MDAVDIARAELRSYSLRRCIRFYTALVLIMAWGASTQLVRISGAKLADEANRTLAIVTLMLFAVLVAVEVASATVMGQLVRMRDGQAGPEKSLWRFAAGAGPSWIAAALYGCAAVVVALATSWTV